MTNQEVKQVGIINSKNKQMEKIKKNWLSAIAALTLVLGVIFAVNALEKKVEVKPSHTPDPVTVHFNLRSSLQSDIEMESNWSKTPSNNCPGFDYLCDVTYDAAIYPTLAAFLAANPTQSLIEQNALEVHYKD